MAKKKAKRSVSRKSRSFVEYNSLTFILFLVFVLLVSVLLVAKMVAAN
ncbi:MAG: hypothetical protein HY344_01065 [Candidatus Levybacteria bacterium]|nr:hypothetical protein [Candidatus Levybacteria bacterium]